MGGRGANFGKGSKKTVRMEVDADGTKLVYEYKNGKMYSRDSFNKTRDGFLRSSRNEELPKRITFDYIEKRAKKIGYKSKRINQKQFDEMEKQYKSDRKKSEKALDDNWARAAKGQGKMWKGH